MKRLFSFAAVGLSVFLYTFSLSGPIALAAAKASAGQALEIAPPLLPLKANPGQTIKAKIQLRDVSSSNLVVTNEINDFVAQGENGTPKIITGNDNDNPFSIKNWINPLPSFTLAPQKIETLTVSIHVPRNASPGGHYGIIRFTGTAPQLKGTGVSLQASLGALVLLTVNGKLTENLSVAQFASSTDNPNTTKPVFKSLFQSAPVGFVVRIKNSGNIQEQPVGHIAVTDMFGKAVANININIPPHNILPDSIRMFTGALDKTNIGTKHLFGRYHAVLTMSYGDGTQKVLTASLSFWVIPFKLIGIIILLLIIAFFGIRFMLRRYKKRILNQAHGGVQYRSKNTKRTRK